MLGIALAALLAATPAAQTPPPDTQQPVALEDVVVTGRPLDDLIRDFVSEVAEPNRGRNLARWDRTVCVGVANLRREPAQYITDRVSTIASDLGLEAGHPGCSPNILIIAAADGRALAQELVSRRRGAFRMGGTGMDRGSDALREFQDSDRVVRWWQMAMPVDSETGDRAIALPGECSGNCTGPMSYAPTISVFAASRLHTQIVDNLFRTIVIVDVNRLGGISGQQLADYIAMVTLAQIDPEADTSAYATILNVFDDPTVADSLTGWDQAYLEGLYGAERGDASMRANRSEISRSIRRARERARAEDTTQPDGR